MPEPKIFDVSPNQIQRGDWVYLPGDVIEVAKERPAIKQKFAYLLVERDSEEAANRPIRLPLDNTYRVSRLVATEEEAEAARLERAIQSITDRRATLEGMVEQYRQSLIENLDMLDSSWHGRKWANYAEAQFELTLWNKVFKIAENREVNLAEALDIFAEFTKVEFIRRGNFSPRSTSAIHNYCETMENDITARFLRDYEMFGF